jgi:sugar lactone lactonase YvrE
MYIADYTGHNVLRVDMSTRQIEVFAHEPSMNQPNDIAIGADDVIYASDPNWSASTGKMWRVETDGSVHLLEADMGTTNGIEVSPGEDLLYVNESNQKNVWVYDLQAGAVTNKRLLIQFPDFSMDGMRCDVEGNLYVTRHGKGTVAKLSPAGDVLLEVELTGKLPSNIAFGGPDGCAAYVMLQDEGNVETFRVDAPGREWQLAQR